MSGRQIKRLSLAALAAGMILAGFGPAEAAGVATHVIAKRIVDTAGPVSYPTPLAGIDVFRAAEQGITQPTGVPGIRLTGSEAAREPAAADEAMRAYGLSLMPYTTARVAIGKLGPATSAAMSPVTSPPYRATGALYIHFASTGWAVCTAALIKKGVIVTAAHCVFQFGKKANGWPDAIRFYPAQYANDPATIFGLSPYGFYVGNAITFSPPGTTALTPARKSESPATTTSRL